jgi:GH25 family lysozyme M1 (1,4-beta-N-acetylmuramidase)
MIRTIIDISHWEDPIDFKKVAAAGIVAELQKHRKARPGLIAPMRSSRS